MTRPAPPPVEYRPPDCSICGEETSTEDEWLICHPCGAQWQAERFWEPGSWVDDDLEPCLAVNPIGGWICRLTTHPATDWHRTIDNHQWKDSGRDD